MSTITQKLLNQARTQPKKPQIDEEEGEDMDDCSCCCTCCTPQYYQEYFQVSHQDVTQRIKCALLHDNRFHVVSIQQPDLYGPFWIQTTLIFILVVGTVLSEYFLKQKMIRENQIMVDFDQIQREFQFLPNAMFLIYGFGYAQPVLIFIFLRLHGIQESLASLICLYGYSFSCFIIVTLACFIPSYSVQIGALTYGLLSSYTFLFRNYNNDSWNDRQQINAGSMVLLKILVFFTQAALAVFYKIFFFEAIRL